MKIIVISDTHIPISAKDIPSRVLTDIKDADMIIHAGDLIEMDFLKQLQGLKPVKAVSGNMDSAEVKSQLKEREVFLLEGFKIGIIHGWGHPYKLLDLIKTEFKNTSGLSCVIYGHSHIASINMVDGVIYFNPGSSTDKVFAPYNSYGVLEIKDNKIIPHIIKL